MTVPAPREQRGIDLDTCDVCGEPQAVCDWLGGCHPSREPFDPAWVWDASRMPGRVA